MTHVPRDGLWYLTDATLRGSSTTRFDVALDAVRQIKNLSLLAVDLLDLERVHPPETDEEATQRHERLWQHHGAELLRLTGRIPDIAPIRSVSTSLEPWEWDDLFLLADQVNAVGRPIASPVAEAGVAAIDKLRHALALARLTSELAR